MKKLPKIKLSSKRRKIDINSFKVIKKILVLMLASTGTCFTSDKQTDTYIKRERERDRVTE